MPKPETTKVIAQQNDQFRKKFMIPQFGVPEIQGRYLMTNGIVKLGPFAQIEIASKVREFNDFSEDNDPYKEHDFGSIRYNDNKIFWKIDYYDESYKYGSEAPADSKLTRRVLTAMLASEY